MKKEFVFHGVIFLLVILETIQADKYCYDFNESKDQWVTTGESTWKWSGEIQPITEFIITWEPSPSGEYWWLQNLILPTTISTVSSTANQTIILNVNDEISILFYRHILWTPAPDDPILYFIINEGTTKMPIIFPKAYDMWESASITCTSDTPCCEVYPCAGFFAVEGTTLSRDDLYAFDKVSVNKGCGTIQTD